MKYSKISKSRLKKLKNLARLMGRQSKKFMPITRELIECFNSALEPAEIDFLASMGRLPHTFESLETLSGMDRARFRPFLDAMLRKGFIRIDRDADGRERYELQAIVVGWFEKYLASGTLTPEKRNFGRWYDAYLMSFSKFGFGPLRVAANIINRAAGSYYSVVTIPRKSGSKTISVDEHLRIPEKQVLPAAVVDELIEKHGAEGKITAMNCFCRRVSETVGEPCRFEHEAESCIGLGDQADYIARCGLGRRISKEEARNIIYESERRGAVHTVMHFRDDPRQRETEICNCCWDCCGILSMYNRGVLGLNLDCHFISEARNAGECGGCGRCAEYCPVMAVTVEGAAPSIEATRCIGCGQCAFQCPAGVFTHVPARRNVVLPLLKKTETRLPVRRS